jgi:lipopolysaccharide export system protein LptA
MGTATLKNRQTLALFLIFIFLAFHTPAAWGAEAKKKAPEGEFPLHITAARLEADQKEGVIVFSGQVKALYGESTLYADQLRVYYQSAPSSSPPPKEMATQSPLSGLGGEKITHIVARGQVRFVQEDRVATGQEATFYKDREEVVLTGNPQVWRAENTLKGERIIFNLKDNKMMVESSPQKRVEAHLYPATPPSTSGTKAVRPPGPKGRKGPQP